MGIYVTLLSVPSFPDRAGIELYHQYQESGHQVLALHGRSLLMLEVVATRQLPVEE